ncbi:MAG: cell wall-binding repeat-containing protein [Coriobacteriia bacterium]|nr:cell wall-binding repeat-containing protein [Coriobacteriia bacterium]
MILIRVRGFAVPLACVLAMAFAVSSVGLHLVVWGASAPEASAQGVPTSAYFEVNVVSDSIGGALWPPDVEVSVRFGDLGDPDYQTTFDTGASGTFGTPELPYDIVPGQTITVTDGVTTKSHLVSAVAVMWVDVANETVHGTAEPYAPVEATGGGSSETVQASGDGTWVADLSAGVIVAGTEGRAVQWDEDDDATWTAWRAPDPRFTVLPESDLVTGVEWTSGGTLVVVVEDSMGSVKGGFEVPRDESGGFEIWTVGADITPGDLVTVSEDETVKTHRVTDLMVTEVDPTNDTVSGTTSAGAIVTVFDHEAGSPAIDVLPDTMTGAWSADFFDNGWDLVSLSEGAARQGDDDGDATLVEWAGPGVTENTPPTAVPDGYAVSQGDTLSVAAPGVLSNDTDAEDDPLWAGLVNPAAHGDVALSPDGGLSYVPDHGFVGIDYFAYQAYDGAAASGLVEVEIAVSWPPLPGGLVRVADENRYLTSVAASVKGFEHAETVVIATGANWPDALGGSALAGAVRGPLLLTRPEGLPDEVVAEIARRGAKKAYVLGGAAAVSGAVDEALEDLLGQGAVERLQGANRYETAREVADETIEVLGSSYGGHAFVATGRNFPDATGAAPVAAALGRPILLADLVAGTVYVPADTHTVMILGGHAAVPASIEEYLVAGLGGPHVDRLPGATRYATAAMVAEHGVGAGMRWNGVGLSTGLNFPDALSGGAMLGRLGSVMLLTRPDALSFEAEAALYGNRAVIETMFIFGGDAAVSDEVEEAARAAAGL